MTLISPSSPAPLTNIGNLQDVRGNLAGAEASLTRALTIEDASILRSALTNLGLVQVQRGV